MYTPEYTITSQTLKNIANIEYAKAIIESTTIFRNWQKQLESDAKSRTIAYSLQKAGLNVSQDGVRHYLNKMPTNASTQVKKYALALNKIEKMALIKEFDEKEVKELYKTISGKTKYRSKRISGATDPQEILAKMTELIDWNNSLGARETHKIITTAILKAKIELIQPFETANSIVSDLVAILSLKTSGYGINNYYSLEEFFYQTYPTYKTAIQDLQRTKDFTGWIEYYTDIFSREISNVSENVKILAKDTKVAKAAGKISLSDRQERIVTYLQDYGILQNKDFTRLFPNISEDTVLRELKALIQKGIVTKRGSTKSSRYELV